MAANKTITQRIALVGGQEIEVQFKNLGESGAAAIKRIDEAAERAQFGAKLSAAIANVQTNFKNAGKAFEQTGQSLDKLEASVRGFVTKLTIATAAVTGFAAAFVKLAESVGASVEAQENAATAAGLTFEQYNKLQGAFQIAGVDSEKFGTLMNRLNKSVGDAKNKADDFQKSQQKLSEEFASGKITSEQFSDQMLQLTKNSQESNDALTKLGLSGRSFGKDSAENLRILLDALQQLPRGAERSALELELLGRSGSKIDAIVDKGAKGFEELQKAAEKARPPLSDVARLILTDMDDAFDQLKLRLQSIKENFVLAFGTSITDLIEAINNAIDANRGKIQQFAFFLNALFEQVTGDIVKLLNGEEINPEGFVAKFLVAFNKISDAAKIVIGAVETAFTTLSKTFQNFANIINNLFGTKLDGDTLAIITLFVTFSGVLGTIVTAVTALIGLFTGLGALLAAVFGPEAALFIGAFALATLLTNLATTLFPSVQQAFNDLAASFDEGLTAIVDLWNAVTDAVSGAIDAVKSFFGAGGGNAGGGQAGVTNVGAASGGYIRGPGSGTSDSILARLSNGEFVQRAAAVSYYGPQFMSALNNLRIPRGILTGLAGFANGGLVSAISAGMIPAFASGGLVSDAGNASGSRGNLTLNIGGELFTGIAAEDKTFTRLSKYATRRNIQSAGRKPNWMG